MKLCFSFSNVFKMMRYLIFFNLKFMKLSEIICQKIISEIDTISDILKRIKLRYLILTYMYDISSLVF